MHYHIKLHLLTGILLAFFCSNTLARIYKRSGYYIKLPNGPPAHSAHFEEPLELETPTGPGYEPPESNKYVYVNYKQNEGVSVSTSDGGKAGYSVGSGLRSIAQGSANQAYTAVAKQHAAAKQAAFIAKNTLAQAASQAAATAQAALEGKQVILQEFEQQAAEAQRALSRELEQLKLAKIASKLAQQTAQGAHNHISVLIAAVNNAKALAEQADHAAKEVDNQYASQSTMVGQAKNRLDQVEEQYNQARIDYVATKEAATKASSSAAEAQVNASKAAAHASIGLHESANNIHPNETDDEIYNEEHIERTSNGHKDVNAQSNSKFNK